MLLRLLGLRRWALLASVAFFALSFATVPSVNRVSGRTTVVALAPLLGAMSIHITWKRTGRPLLLMLSLGLVLLSLLAKETALACPILFGALTWITASEGGLELKTPLRDAAIYLVPVAVYVVWRLLAVGTQMGYDGSLTAGIGSIRNLATHGAIAFAPWMSGLSARMALLALLATAWLSRAEDRMSIAGFLMMLVMLLPVSNLPPRSNYTYAALPGAAILFGSLARCCSRGSLAAIPVVLLLGSFLAARDEAGRMVDASEYTERIIDRLIELDLETRGAGPVFVSGIEYEKAGYGTLWPNAFREALATRGHDPRHTIVDAELFWEELLAARELDESTVGHFSELKGNEWHTLAFRPSDRSWGASEGVVCLPIEDGFFTATDSLWKANSCMLVTGRACSLAIHDPLSDGISILSAAETGGDTLWFDLEGSRAWLLSRPPFPVVVLGECADQSRLVFSSRRLWLPVVLELMRVKSSELEEAT